MKPVSATTFNHRFHTIMHLLTLILAGKLPISHDRQFAQITHAMENDPVPALVIWMEILKCSAKDLCMVWNSIFPLLMEIIDFIYERDENLRLQLTRFNYAMNQLNLEVEESD